MAKRDTPLSEECPHGRKGTHLLQRNVPMAERVHTSFRGMSLSLRNIPSIEECPGCRGNVHYLGIVVTDHFG